MGELLETGAEPEFFITDVVRCERATDGAMRVFVACSRNGHMVMQFTVVGSLGDFAKMAKQVLDMATDGHGGTVTFDMPQTAKAH